MPEASPEHHDTAGVRRPQTRRAGRICANSFAQSLGQPGLHFELDLDANAPRQNCLNLTMIGSGTNAQKNRRPEGAEEGDWIDGRRC